MYVDALYILVCVCYIYTLPKFLLCSSLAIAHKGTAEQVTRFVVLEYKTRSGDSNTDQAPGKTVWKDEVRVPYAYS